MKQKEYGSLAPFAKDQASVFACAKDRETRQTVRDAPAPVNVAIARALDSRRSGNKPMHPSGEVGRFQMDNLSSPPGDW